MRPDNELKKKLDDLVRNVATAGRAQVEALIESVVDAGGTSESALVEMLRNRNLDLSLRLNACWLVPRLKIPAADSLLKALLLDPLEQMREEAALGLGLLSSDDVVDVLLDTLEHDNAKSVRLAALHALGIQSLPRSATGMIAILQNLEEDADVRADTVEALAHIKDQRIVDVLIRSLQDKSSLVRYSAAYALGEQGDSRALPALREVASRDHGTTQWGDVMGCAQDAIEKISGRDQ